MEHLFSPNSSEDQKKVFTKKGTLFSPISSRDLRSDAHQSQIIRGHADVDHTQIIGGGYIPPGFRHPCLFGYHLGFLLGPSWASAVGPSSKWISVIDRTQLGCPTRFHLKPNDSLGCPLTIYEHCFAFLDSPLIHLRTLRRCMQ